jgi:hypothetical protein
LRKKTSFEREERTGLPGRERRDTKNVKDRPLREGKEHGSEDPPLQEERRTGLPGRERRYTKNVKDRPLNEAKNTGLKPGAYGMSKC